MTRDEFQQEPRVVGMMNSVLDMLYSRYQLGTQIKMSNRQLDKQIWGSERSQAEDNILWVISKGIVIKQ